jgi:predicted alpha/beta hydrolase family esterase
MAGSARPTFDPTPSVKPGGADGIHSDPPILIVPGLNNSSPDHWQGRWLSTLPHAALVDQGNWIRPVLGGWIACLLQAIRRTPGAVLVGHSLGCVLIAHVAALPEAQSIAGALLVAPADVDTDGPVGDLLRPFSPVPRSRLPFPTAVAASRNDPFVAFGRAQAFSSAWGSHFVDVGAAGHINVASGHGPWPLGEDLLAGLSDRVQARQHKEAVLTGASIDGRAVI